MCGPVGEGLAACLVGVACGYTKAVTRPKLRRHPEIAGGVTMEWSHATRKSRGDDDGMEPRHPEIAGGMTTE